MGDKGMCPLCDGMGVRMPPSGVLPRKAEVCLCQQQRITPGESGICPLCDGMGMRVVRRANGSRFAEPCSCKYEQKIQSLLRKAQIPPRYVTCSLENFKPGPNFLALNKAYGFVERYPLNAGGIGLLFTGPIGTGKTHLATAILQKLALEREVRSLFCDYRELLKQITNSYNKDVSATELSVLKPLFDAEVLLIDEIGAVKPTDWIWDTVALLLNTRYNDRRTTILTTNYLNRPAGEMQTVDMSDKGVLDGEVVNGLSPVSQQGRSSAGRSFSSEALEARRATRELTLGDRIGDRMWSRLQEMCEPVLMQGYDFRRSEEKRARLP